tara:strand:- start:1205 stop:1846 length:642 start_codon:yes stop_codon:yes gene_type:complete
MNLQYLIDNKSTLTSLNQKLINFKKEYKNNSTTLENLLNIFIFIFALAINLICAAFSAKLLVKGNISGMLLFPSMLAFDYFYLNFIFFINEKVAIGKKYNKFQQALHEFVGDGISFSKKELIESTINNLTKKEKNILEEFIEKSDKKYKIKMQSHIEKILIENKESFHKYNRNNLIEIINFADNKLKSELIDKVIAIDSKKNKINKKNVVLEI